MKTCANFGLSFSLIVGIVLSLRRNIETCCSRGVTYWCHVIFINWGRAEILMRSCSSKFWNFKLALPSFIPYTPKPLVIPGRLRLNTSGICLVLLGRHHSRPVQVVRHSVLASGGLNFDGSGGSIFRGNISRFSENTPGSIFN